MCVYIFTVDIYTDVPLKHMLYIQNKYLQDLNYYPGLLIFQKSKPFPRILRALERLVPYQLFNNCLHQYVSCVIHKYIYVYPICLNVCHKLSALRFEFSAIYIKSTILVIITNYINN